MQLTFEQAKKILSEAKRWELRDHAFGDAEFGWDFEPLPYFTAGGYSGGGSCDVWIELDKEITNFKGDEARELKQCGILGTVDRNDETGPDEYVSGRIMPKLTKEGVYKELTGNTLGDS